MAIMEIIIAFLAGGGITGVLSYFIVPAGIRRQVAAQLEAVRTEAKAMLAAASSGAEAVRDAGVRQAIDTERLRLRFGVYERHLNRFHELADQIEMLIDRANINSEDAWEFAINGPSMVLAINSAAGRVMLPQHHSIADPIRRATYDHASELAEVYRQHAEPNERPEGAEDQASDHSASLSLALDDLRQAVDIGADARLHQDLDKPDVKRLKVIAAALVRRGGKDAGGEG